MLELLRCRLDCLDEVVEEGAEQEYAGESYERLDEIERKARLSEDKIETHLKTLLIRTSVLDSQANCVEEAFEKTLGRFGYKAKELNTQMFALQQDGPATLNALGKSKERKEVGETSCPLQEAGPGIPIPSDCFLRSFP